VGSDLVRARLLRLAALLALLTLSACTGDEPAEPSPLAPDPGWMSVVQQRIADGEYAFRSHDGALVATNRGQGLRASFDPEGAHITARRGEAGWRLDLRLERWGRAEATVAAASAPLAPGRCRDDGARDELGDCLRRLDRRHDGLVEWWENDRSGLEHGFDLSQRPEGEGPLVFEIEVGGLEVAIDPTGDAAILSGSGARLRYGGLRAWDADAVDLAAHMERSPSGLRLVIDDDDAVYPIVVDPVVTTESWSYDSDLYYDEFGTSVANAGDVDGDGYDDLVVGSPGYSLTLGDEGHAFLFSGSASGLSTTATWTWTGLAGGGHAGQVVCGAGDVNGDGYADVAVAAPDVGASYNADTGTVYVFHGSASGLSSMPDWSEAGANGNFGASMDSAGDVNGDGFADLVVGNPSYDTNYQVNAGRATLYLGSSTGLGSSASWVRGGSANGDNLGQTVAGVGDVDGDGYDDVAVADNGYWSQPQYGDSDDDGFHGAVDVYLGGPSGPDNSPEWSNTGDQAGGGYGDSIDGAGDVDGDGYGDLLIGADSYTSGQVHEGRAYLYAGGSGGPDLWSSWTAEANLSQAWFGTSVASAGDLNGDGYADVVIGAPGWSDLEAGEGAAFVYLGSGSGLQIAAAWYTDGDQTNAELGTSVSSAGDTDGDGFAEVAVAAPMWDGGQNDEGKVQLFAGSGAGLAADEQWTGESNQGAAHFGTSVASAGDVNGDGRDDLLVGAPGYDNGHTDEGRAYYYMGLASGPSSAASWTGEANSAEAEFGDAVAGAGDVNGDGYDDVLIGAPGTSADSGAAHLYLGSSTGPDSAADSIFVGDGGSRMGSAVAGAGDVNGDGYADVIVGAESWTSAVIDEGAAFVYAGSASGLVGAPLWSAAGGQNLSNFGIAVAGLGDTDGDGFADVAVGGDGFDDTYTNQGRVDVFLGSATGPSATADLTLWGAAGGDRLGGAVAGAGDVNGDGLDDLLVGSYGATNTASSEGRAQLFEGTAAGPSATPSWTVWGVQQGSGFGVSVDGAGDVDADGYADVLVGAAWYDGGQTNEGKASLFRGSDAGLDSSPSWEAEGDQGAALFGASVAGAGDVDGDGFGDVLVGAWKYDLGQSNEGAAFFYPGGSADGTDPAHEPFPQLRDPSTTWPRRPWTRSTVAGHNIIFFAASHEGRSRLKLEVETKARGVPFDGASTVVSTSWTDVGTLGQDFVSIVTGMGNETDFHWRARLLHDPTKAPVQGRSRWLWGGVSGSPEGVHWRTPCTADTDGDGACDSFDPDLDGDGWQPPADCDDADPTINPDAVEIADDGIDQNCNGFDLITCWLDNDGDGFGGGTVVLTIETAASCEEVSGFASTAGDCDDANPLIYPGAAEVCDGLDDDCDGAIPTDETDDDGDGFSECADGDCDDDDVSVYDGAPELCDGVDNDCDGAVPPTEADGDGDGWMVCDGDCNDSDAAVNPSAVELCNGIDDNCDGVLTGEADADGDGQRVCDGDCDDGNTLIFDGAPERCDGWDNDCDGSPYETDNDADGFYPCAYATPSNPAFGGDDCDDGEPLANPGQEEVCDGFDNDCDGAIDEDLDADADGFTTCAGDCDDADPAVYDGAAEICDGKDSDCDGVLPVDEDDTDTDGYVACSLHADASPPTTVQGGGDCAPSDATTFPGAAELCDGVDNDCDGALPGDEADADADGSMACAGDCDDTDPTTYPGAPELCDAADNDCNSVIPVDELDGDGDGVSACAGDCNDNNAAVFPGAIEACNGVDDDCDGAVPADETDDDGDGFDECADDDCDDDDASVFVGAMEACNGIDDNCDGAVPADETDDDGDGFDECADDDCDDADPAVYLGATEVCDGDDEDCDGDIDEGFDVDGDFFTSCGGDCDDGDVTAFPGAAETCDGVDDDCDGDIDEDFDADGDGQMAEADCPGGTDCDDADPTRYLGAPEVCNAADDDCDGEVDETFDVDGDGWFDGDEVGCTAAWPQTDCDDADPAINPGVAELCDGIDGDCDGAVPADETDGDGDGYVECAAPSHLPGFGGDCDDDDGGQYPGAAEACNAEDDDCDGAVDEDFDVDGDGAFDGDVVFCDATYGGLADCDDADPTVFPGAEEDCDGVDDDCNGVVDDGYDGDGDGWTTCAGDCDDEDAATNPDAVELCGNGLDDDCDGLIDQDLDQDGDGVTTCDGDCDDLDPLALPGASEVCDAIDNDCDTAIDEDFDADGDGFVDAAVPACAAAWPELDCDDSDASIFPDAQEVCDGLDQDCDGDIDEDFDLDADGYYDAEDPGCLAAWGAAGSDCDDLAAGINPGAAEACNTLDDDCDGDVDEDFDGDGDGAFDGDDPACATNYGDAVDCDDDDPNVSPLAPELCNGLDDDCEGSIPEEETDEDGDGYVDCESPEADHVGSPAGGGDCDDADPDSWPGAPEVCDGADQDCDGQVDEDFDADGDGFADGGVPACEVAWGESADCDDGDPAISPAATEVCDGIDQDCDGQVDEDFDADEDGWFDGDEPDCAAAWAELDCDDGDPAIFPFQIEDCGNGVDDNCDGQVDEDEDVDGDGVTTCAGDCDDDDAAIFPGATEVCDGRDDDCDLLIDEDFDADGDGTTSCGGDCDDSAPGTHPGAPESCDGTDEDCDGAVDEIYDLDGDGVFDAFEGDCIATYGLFNTDCDDSDGDVYPGAAETCDGVDEDCDGDIDEDCGDDDDSAIDDDDVTPDDDDSALDDDDATPDDDDVTPDDDDATVDDDDDSAPGAPFFYAGCLMDCSLTGPGRGGAGLLAALFGLLLYRRSRRRSVPPAGAALGLALLALLAPSVASAATVVVLTPDADASSRKLARELPKDHEILFVEQRGEQTLGGVWLVGATPDFACTESELPAATVSEALQRAQSRIDELEMVAAGSDLAGVRQTVACLETPVESEELWLLYFLEGVAAFYSSGANAAQPALARALAVLPSHPFDDSYPPELRELYLRQQGEALGGGRATIAAGQDDGELPGALWVDGRPVAGPPIQAVPGEHIFQFRDATGALRGARVQLSADDAVALAPPTSLPTAAAKMELEPQHALARWLGRQSNRAGARAWIHDGHDATAKLGEEAPTVRQGPRRTPTVGRDRPEPLAGRDRLLIIALGGGYQSTGRGSYGALALDVSVRLFRPLRLAVFARPAISEPVIDPATGESLGRMGLLTFGLGPRLRFTRPFVQVIGLGLQLAPSPDASVGGAVVVGPVASFGADIPLGSSPLVLRPLIEVGSLGRFFQFRGMLQLALVVGPEPKP
jgi:hypothetical protein